MSPFQARSSVFSPLSEVKQRYQRKSKTAQKFEPFWVKTMGEEKEPQNKMYR